MGPGEPTDSIMSGDDAVERTSSAHSDPRVRRLEDENIRLRAECDSLGRDLIKLSVRDRELRSELEFSRRRLGEVLGSLPWRLNWPLRILESIMRRIRSQFKAGLFRLPPTRGITNLDPRLEKDLKALTHFPTPRAFSILFLNGISSDSHAARYRIHNVREALVLSGVRSEVTTELELSANSVLLLRNDLLVIFRAAWTAKLARIIGQCNSLGIPVIWDADDYIFEPEIVITQYIDALRRLPSAQVDLYLQGVQRYRKSLVAADYYTGPTEFLVQRAGELGKPGYVIPNFLGRRLLEISAGARDTKNHRPADGLIRMVFMGGTPTHQRDFGSIAPVIARILKERTQTRLKIIGHLDLTEFQCFENVTDQITKHDAVPWQDLPELVKDCDICIVPLDIPSPFCQAKSDLKFIEGAASGLAVVASATAPYRRHMDHGNTGFLCETADEWYQVLLRLVDEEDTREATIRNGIHEVLENRTVEEGSRESVTTYRRIIHDFRVRKGVSDRSLVIRWVVPPLEIGSGGHEAIYVAAHQMAIRGHLVSLHFQEGGTFKAANLLQIIRRQLGYNPQFQVVVGTDEIRSCDSLIATQNTTVGIVDRLKKSCFLPAYFIQDFEPHFYAVGAEYFAAEQAYRYDFLCMVLGKWLADVMRTKYGRRTRQVDFWLDRNVYYAPSGPLQQRDCPRVVFLARPNMPRRCFELGMSALFQFHRMVPDAEIVLFGAQKVPPTFLDFPFRSLGVLTKAQLGHLYRTAHVGLAFSTTNPSLVPLEMMGCGLPVVDLDVLDSRLRHGADYPALLTPPDAQSLAEAMEALCRNPSWHADLSKRSLEFTSGFLSREEALKQVSIHIEREIGIEVCNVAEKDF